MVSLSGGPPVPLTHFASEPVFVPAYAWSKDGKKSAVTRARYNDTMSPCSADSGRPSRNIYPDTKKVKDFSISDCGRIRGNTEVICGPEVLFEEIVNRFPPSPFRDRR